MTDTTGRGRSPKRGAVESPRSELAAASPHVVLPGAPPNFIKLPQQISAWGNVQTSTSPGYGDCVTAEEAFAKACNNPEIFISEQEVIRWATAHDALNGAVLVNVLKAMHTDGFQQDDVTYKDGQYFSVNWTSSSVLQSAISQGPVKIGIAASQLENVWTGQNGWFAVGLQPESNVDHCVSLCGYGTLTWLSEQLDVGLPAGVNGGGQGYAMFTWDSIGIIDVPSMMAITHEAWLRNPTTVVVSPGV